MTYASARDLPIFVELEGKRRALRLLRWLLPGEQRAKLQEFGAQLEVASFIIMSGQSMMKSVSRSILGIFPQDQMSRSSARSWGASSVGRRYAAAVRPSARCVPSPPADVPTTVRSL
jgi:hypothetical protein